MSNTEHKVKLLASVAEILWDADYDEDPSEPNCDNEHSDFTIYMVVLITAFMMMFVLAVDTAFFPLVSVVAGTGISLSIFLTVADKFSFASNLMIWIKRLG